MTFLELEHLSIPVSTDEVGNTGNPRNPMVNGLRFWRKPGIFCTLLNNEELLIKFENIYWDLPESRFAVVSAKVLADVVVDVILREAGFVELEA